MLLIYDSLKKDQIEVNVTFSMQQPREKHEEDVKWVKKMQQVFKVKEDEEIPLFWWHYQHKAR